MWALFGLSWRLPWRLLWGFLWGWVGALPWQVHETRPQAHALWQLAEQFGAECSLSIDSSVTHVVAASSGTDKVQCTVPHTRVTEEAQGTGQYKA